MGHRLILYGIISVVVAMLFVSTNDAYSADPPLYMLHKNGFLQELETTTFSVTSSFNINLDGYTITRATSLAYHPTTGELFGVVQVASPGDPDAARLLIKIDVTDGSAILVGVLTDSISEIAFDSNTDTLYAVSGFGSTNSPNTIFTVDTTTAALTPVCSVSVGDAGQSIGYNPNNPGFLYHGTGNSEVSGAVFETLDLGNSCNPSGITINPPKEYDELSALTFLDTEGVFLAGDTSMRLHRLALDGTVTQIGAYPSGSRVAGITGLAVGFVNPPVPSPDSDGDGVSDQIEQMLNSTNDVVFNPSIDISSVELSLNQTSGDITINGTDSGGNSLALIELPFGTNSSAQVDISYDTGGFGSSVIQISGFDVPYPPGKTVTFKAGASFTNKVCFVDAPSGVSLTSFIFSSCSDDIPNSIVRMTCPLGPPANSRLNVGPFPDEPFYRDYTCERITTGSDRFFEISGLAFSDVGEFLDTDDDSINDFSDNCVLVPNASQEDSNDDNVGDACTVTAEICGPDTVPDLENNYCAVDPTITQQITDLTNQVNTLLEQLASLPQNVVESLLNDVNGLTDSNVLDEKDSKKIVKDLEKGLKDIEKGNEKSCKDVSKFVKDINKLIAKGKLTSEIAQPLLDEANAMLSNCTFSDDEDDD